MEPFMLDMRMKYIE